MLAVVRRVPPAAALPVVGLLAVTVLALGPRPALIGFAWLALVTPRLVETDLAEHRLPDAVVLPGYPVVLGAVLLHAWSTGVAPLDAVLAGAACGLVFLLLHVAGGMGFGDVKLAPLLGALAAVAVPGGALLWLVAAFLLGGVGAVVVLVRRGLGARLPLGPPMLLAAWLVLAVAV
ncbi:prepilin peptidase [Amnibacterium kyonggiense]|uniref:Type IV leader peptidase family protein n=1 Tax=Amnibacterium kyonggiense TaxID=595671 RepID=A0A4R7FGX9_9MICO|nr:prepilin peptidase [Amnibacterium kyonggiense]TDS76025.1 type IV leader peptidase family protein [Amnibacterium kyonggiense]